MTEIKDLEIVRHPSATDPKRELEYRYLRRDFLRGLEVCPDCGAELGDDCGH